MTFDQNERALFARLADVLIPAGSGQPSASEAEVQGDWLDQVLAARPDLVVPLKDLLAKAEGHDAGAFVLELRTSGSPFFGVLAEIVPAAYFMNPTVQKAIGYSGQGPKPMDPYPDYMEHGLLESIIKRGPIYRATPGQSP
jgi:hypothetical protein